MNPHDLEAAHTRAFNAALEKFNGIRKMGGESFAAIYLERLKSQLQQLANEYRVANTNKNIFQVSSGHTNRWAFSSFPRLRRSFLVYLCPSPVALHAKAASSDYLPD